MIKIEHKGDFKNTLKYFKNLRELRIEKILRPYGERGVEALKQATPVDTGLTADSWTYEIAVDKDSYSISWINTNVVNHVQIAIILQYGHATRNGGWVEGRDYINPAIQPIFDDIDKALRREVAGL